MRSILTLAKLYQMLLFCRLKKEKYQKNILVKIRIVLSMYAYDISTTKIFQRFLYKKKSYKIFKTFFLLLL